MPASELNTPHDCEMLLGSPTWYQSSANVTTTSREVLRRWLVLKGVPTHKVAQASDLVLANAYRVGNAYINKMIRDDFYGNFAPKKRHNPRLPIIDFDELDSAVGVFNSPQIEYKEPETTTTSSLGLTSDQINTIVSRIGPVAEQVINGHLTTMRQQVFSHATEAAQSAAKDAAKDAVNDAATKATLTDNLRGQLCTLVSSEVARLTPPRTIEVKNTNGHTVNVGRQHENFETLLRMVSARGANGHRLNIWLTGPTGSGKTTAAEKVAEALAPTFTNYRRDSAGKWTLLDNDGNILDLGISHNGPFGADSSLDADYKLVGHKNAQGTFQWTTFLRIFCYGGLYVMDEIDNWEPSPLVAANAPLANGWVSTPAGMMQRHPDCCILAAANTWGLGATSDYVGRSKLDAATLNRFPNKLDWPIDEKLERAIARDMGDDQWNWCTLVQTTRQAAKDQGLQVIFSPRNTFEGIALLKVGFSINEVVKLNLTPGLKSEQIKALNLNRKFDNQTDTDIDTYHVYEKRAFR